MAQYINKDAVIAEIERKINEINLDSIEDWRYRLQREHDIEVMKNILSLINTLEMKEIDLGRESMKKNYPPKGEFYMYPQYDEEDNLIGFTTDYEGEGAFGKYCKIIATGETL
jgi:hypothetical protein